LYNLNRNKRAKARDSLSQFINGISISDMDSVRTQLGMLSMLSSQTDEISRLTQVNILKFRFKNIKTFTSDFKCIGCNNESMHSLESIFAHLFVYETS
jgi:hypothetical protein